MAATAANRFGKGIARGSTGPVVVGDGTVLTVTLGFRPKHIRLVNLTDVVLWEKIAGMTDAQTLKTVAAGTMTTDTTSAIVITDTGFTVAAAAFINAKSFVWFAE